MVDSQNRKKQIIHWALVLALFCSLIIGLGCFSFCELFLTPKYAGQEPLKVGAKTVEVLVAKNKIKSFDAIIATDLKQVKIAQNEEPLLCVNNLGKAIDRIAVKDFDKGEIIRSHMIKKPILSAEYVDIGIRYANEKQRKKAISFFESALELNPDNSYTYEWLGHTQRKLGRSDQAMKSFRRAIDINPKSAYSYSCIGFLYKERKKYPQAIKNWEKAIDLDPEYPQYYAYLGEVLFRDGQSEKGLEKLNKAIELEYDKASAFYYRSYCHYQLKHYDLARKDIITAIDKNYWNEKATRSLKAKIERAKSKSKK